MIALKNYAACFKAAQLGLRSHDYFFFIEQDTNLFLEKYKMRIISSFWLLVLKFAGRKVLMPRNKDY
jgi:hypothetical protein